MCTSDEACDGGGNCVIGSTLTCPDSDLCTWDHCDPSLGCLSEARPTPIRLCPYTTSKSKVLLVDTDGPKDRLVWAHRNNHDSFTPGDFGDPTTTTDYALCIYEPTRILSKIFIPAGSGWRSGRLGGFTYKDRSGATDGVKSLKLRSAVGVINIKLKAKGEALPLPGAVDSSHYFDPNPQAPEPLSSGSGLVLRAPQLRQERRERRAAVQRIGRKAAAAADRGERGVERLVGLRAQEAGHDQMVEGRARERCIGESLVIQTGVPLGGPVRNVFCSARLHSLSLKADRGKIK